MDLTKITTPFGLLDKETQDALKAWPHGIEIYCGVNHAAWEPAQFNELWRVCRTYRARKSPPREFWHLLDLNGEVYDTFTCLKDAKEEHQQHARFTLVHYREVMDGEAK